MEDYLTFKELKKIDSATWKEVNTYSMNEPIQEELQAQGTRPGLLFIFEATDKGSYLNGDMLSFVISSLQWELPEYECFGKIM